MSNDESAKWTRMPRRQFLAGLLFGGGALTLAALQGVQAQQHPTDGWTLPDLYSPTPKPPPPPEPTSPPEPPLAGKPQVPQPPRPPQPPTAGLPVMPRGRYISPGETPPTPPPPRP